MLIATKLQRPRVAQDYLKRQHLYRALDQARNGKMTLISAPAGYGKSSLVASWLDLAVHKHVWISIDQSDSDINQFLSYLVGGLQQAAPASCSRLSKILQSPNLPPIDYVAAHLVNDLDEIESELTVVLDDFHLIENSLVLELMETLLQYLPRQIHIVMITRADPGLPLVQMRARQEMSEIRMGQLRFSEEEAAIFLQQSLGKSLSSEMTHLLLEKTEGWPVGLRLALLSMHRSDDVHRYAERFGAGGGLVVDYLVAEVLEQTTAGMNEFMLRTSICDRLSVGLCDALVDNSDPLVDTQMYIDALMRTNLFVVELDQQRHWWRYHHLFQELLQHQLHSHCSKEEICELHGRASTWYAENGFLDEAFEHALAAGNIDAAASLLERNRHLMMNEDRWQVVARWLAQLPDPIKRTRPELILARAWVAFYHHAIALIPSILAALDELGDDQPLDEAFNAEIQFFRSLEPFWMGHGTAAVDALRTGLTRFSPSAQQARGEAELFYRVALQMSGQKDAAVQEIMCELYGSSINLPVRQTRMLASLIFVHLLSGDLDEAYELTQQALALAKPNKNAYVEAWTYYLFGLFFYARNQLDEAKQHFQNAVEMRYVLHTRAAVDSLVGLVLTNHALGEPQQADATLGLLLEFATATGDLSYLTIAHSCQARLALLQGDPARAASRLQQKDLATDVGILFLWLEVPRITACRLLIGGQDPADVRVGLQRLGQLRDAALSTHNTCHLIGIDVLRAAGYQRLGQDEQAYKALDNALDQAVPSGWIRPFVDAGTPIADLLRAAGPRHPQQAFIARLLANFPVPSMRIVAVDTEQIPELLTARESEILDLLSQRLTNYEIAEKLVISVATVKRHTANIYQKLDVTNRRLAVAKAQAIGQLPPTP